MTATSIEIFSQASLFAAIFASADVDARNVGALVAGFALAFAIWQFREQRDRVKRPNAYFSGRTERETKFLKRQAFRRLQLSGLAFVAGALMLVGLYLPAERAPFAWTLVWLGVVFFVGWTALLAGVDAVSIWLHYASAGRRQSVEKILIEYKLRQIREQNVRTSGAASENAPENDGANSDASDETPK